MTHSIVDIDAAEKFVAYIVSGIEGAIPEADDQHIAIKVLDLIEAEIAEWA